VILIHQGKIIFEEQTDNLVYNYGVAKCGQENFALLSADDYIIHRTTNMSVECLVRDKEAFKKKYKNIIVDNATLEDIMLFYVKGASCIIQILGIPRKKVEKKIPQSKIRLLTLHG
ncbi:MAG: hypothetical protein UF657_17795, partial [Blautia faecis]|nr:hypothetical protein [Blautia faecis]